MGHSRLAADDPVARAASRGGRVSPAVRAFDSQASRYDRLAAGPLFRAMRATTHAWLAAAFGAGARVLEVGCGTGLDTAFLAARGADVVAIDPSADMIARARARIDRAAPVGRVHFICCGVEEAAHHLPPGLRFDGVASGFGALNCVGSLEPFADLAAARVDAGGRVILSLMSRTCLLELVWFTLHGDLRGALRRVGRGPVAVNVDGVFVPTFYHRVADLRRALAPWFRLERLRGLGCVLPPPYLESAWRATPVPIRRALAWLDARLAPHPPFNRLGDHTLLEFVRCA